MKRILVAFVVGVLFASVIPISSASAQPQESLETLETKLPWSWFAGAAVSTGSVVYLIGGNRNASFTDAIVRFDPAAGSFAEETARLPGVRRGASAVWTGSEILVFGGQTPQATDYNQVVRFNPANGTVRLGANLTSARSFAPVAYDGRYAWIFGGTAGLDIVRKDVLRYDPQADSMQALSGVVLPGYPTYAEATWDGHRVSLFDGWEMRMRWFDPTTGQLSTPAPLVPPTQQASAVQFGGYAYLFGGWDQDKSAYASRILRVRTDTGESALVGANLTRPQAFTAAALVGDRAYVFGGWNGATGSNVIQVFRSVETTSVFLLVGALVIIVVAVVAVAAYVLRRRKRAKGKPRAETEDREPPS